MTAPRIDTIHDRAMLTYLRISSWSARKLDTRATRKVTSDADATSDAARVNKHLLASADGKLKDISKIGGEARRYLEDVTLPWDDAGNRLLPNEKAIEVVAKLTEFEQAYLEAVDAFVLEYPVLRAQALSNLGDLGDDEDYPQPDTVRHKFSFRLSFTPVPNNFSDVRTGLTEGQVDILREHYDGQAKRQMTDALSAAWKRLRENLEAYSDRLREKDDGSGKVQIFRDSMVENLRNTVAILRPLNVFGDMALEGLRTQIEQSIAQFDADQLRTVPMVAKTVKTEVDDILARMKEFL